MQALMQDYPLTLTHVFNRAERLFSKKAIVSAGAAGEERMDYATWAERTRRLGGALDVLGLSPDARVATFAWNSGRHLELYFAAPCSGRVLHTLNIRLFSDQLLYVVNHAEDEAIFVDRSLLGLLWPLVDRFSTVKHIVVMDDGVGDVPDDPRIADYEQLIAEAPPADLVVGDENRAAAMCYTSGTTGNPKGVVYSHRSIFLHSLGVMLSSAMGVSEPDVVLPVVPMFHANAWGLPHAGVFAGSSLVFPGSNMAPGAIADLIERERVTVTAGVPTIWMGMLPELDKHDLSSLRLVVCGGSAVPKSLSEAYRQKLGIPILHAWGMTETSPLGSVCHIRSYMEGMSEEALADIRAMQGVPQPAVDARLVSADGRELPWDGKATGELQVRGPWVAAAYYRDEEGSKASFTDDGWLRTGDVAAMTADGYIRLVDRTKDLVKSGGEWISSVELENEIMAHPKVAEAAVIGVRHSKWQERPLACVVPKAGEDLTKHEILDHLSQRVAKWWLPDDIVFLEEIPKTSVGKFSKKDLRDRFSGYRLPTD
ncbi:MAG TPA: long-chain fatty acid--CoA ligase [Actinomycetota bacterium]|jgi:fatty-acyl-CoA synthase|nr:long-chain fatty acid--CoA ligase [Actinomycetota bacterium]